jgi:hypothetical protein
LLQASSLAQYYESSAVDAEPARKIRRIELTLGDPQLQPHFPQPQSRLSDFMIPPQDHAEMLAQTTEIVESLNPQRIGPYLPEDNIIKAGVGDADNAAVVEEVVLEDPSDAALVVYQPSSLTSDASRGTEDTGVLGMVRSQPRFAASPANKTGGKYLRKPAGYITNILIADPVEEKAPQGIAQAFSRGAVHTTTRSTRRSRSRNPQALDPTQRTAQTVEQRTERSISRSYSGRRSRTSTPIARSRSRSRNPLAQDPTTRSEAEMLREETPLPEDFVDNPHATTVGDTSEKTTHHMRSETMERELRHTGDFRSAA